MIKRLLFIFSTLLLLIGCQEETEMRPVMDDVATDQGPGKERSETLNTTTSNEKEVASNPLNAKEKELPKTADLTEEEAILIHKALFYSLNDAWSNYEAFLYVLYEEDRELLARNLMEHFKTVATDNFLTPAFQNEMVSACNQCDFVFMPDKLHLASEVSFKVTGNKKFDLFVHYPETYMSSERDLTVHYLWDDEKWMIDGINLELFENDPANFEELATEDALPQYSGKALSFKAREQELANKYAHYQQTNEYYSNVEHSDFMDSIVNDYTMLLAEIDQELLTINPYYTVNQDMYASIIERLRITLDKTYEGGSGAPFYRLSAEYTSKMMRVLALLDDYAEQF